MMYEFGYKNTKRRGTAGQAFSDTYAVFYTKLFYFSLRACSEGKIALVKFIRNIK